MEQDFVGTKRWIRQATPYEVYMEEQKLPIHRGTVGFYDIRDLALGSWKRMGAQGAFIELNGCGGHRGRRPAPAGAAGRRPPAHAARVPVRLRRREPVRRGAHRR